MTMSPCAMSALQRASAAGQHQLAVQYALTLQEEFPALPGDAWQLLELLQLCWPAGMAAPRVALLVDRAAGRPVEVCAARFHKALVAQEPANGRILRCAHV